MCKHTHICTYKYFNTELTQIGCICNKAVKTMLYFQKWMHTKLLQAWYGHLNMLNTSPKWVDQKLKLKKPSKQKDALIRPMLLATNKVRHYLHIHAKNVYAYIDTHHAVDSNWEMSARSMWLWFVLIISKTKHPKINITGNSYNGSGFPCISNRWM